MPARAERDELAGAMLVQSLQRQGFEAHSALTKLGVGELIGVVEKAGADVVCISVVAPSTVLHARYLCLNQVRSCRNQESWWVFGEPRRMSPMLPGACAIPR